MFSESFLLFAQADRSSNLGFVNPQERFIEISVASQDLVIEQSPSLLRSDRSEGTTGAGESADLTEFCFIICGPVLSRDFDLF